MPSELDPNVADPKGPSEIVSQDPERRKALKKIAFAAIGIVVVSLGIYGALASLRATSESPES